MERKKKGAFIAHMVENWTYKLKFTKLFAHLHRNPKLRFWWWWLWPVCAFMSVVYLFSRKGWDTVDSYKIVAPDNTIIEMETVLLRNFAWHFLSAKGRKQVKSRVESAVLDLHERGFVHLGLGALTKAEFINHGGADIVKNIGSQIEGSYVLHADTGTAGGTAKQILRAIEEYGIKSSVFITGATSKIGRALALYLASKGVCVVLYTKSTPRYEEILQEAKAMGCDKFLSQSTSIEDAKNSRLILTGKAKPSGKALLEFIPKNSVVMNFSVPNPFGDGRVHPRGRKDVLLVECGLVAYKPKTFLPLKHNMRLPDGFMYMCFASTATAIWKAYEGHEIGKVDVSRMEAVFNDVEALGFFLPDLPKRVMAKDIVPMKKWTDPWLWQKTQELARTLGLL